MSLSVHENDKQINDEHYECFCDYNTINDTEEAKVLSRFHKQIRTVEMKSQGCMS